MKKILNCILFILCATTLLQAQQRTRIINGKVTSLPKNEPIANALVNIKGTFLETETNTEGAFALAVFPEDELVVTAFLMDPKTISVSETTQPISIQLNYTAEILAAVRINEREKEKKYIETGFGTKDPDKIGYSADKLREQFISPIDVDMYTVARKIPFLSVRGNQLGAQMVFSSRARGGIAAIPIQVVVDGVMVTQSALAIIDPSLVKSITILRGLAGTIKYGSLGAGGVMVITTINSGSGKKRKERFPDLLVKGNEYDEGIIAISENIAINTTTFIEQIEPYTTIEDALQVYEEQRKQPETHNVSYYIDMSNYFRKWGDIYSYKILSDLYRQAKNNPRILKTIAFVLEEREHLEQATFVQEQLLELRPDHIQTYRDVARLYARTGRYSVATALYKQMIFNLVPNVNFESIEPIIYNEFRYLIANHKRKIVYKDIPNEFLAINFKKDVRIVLEYTNPLAEFEVQFVSPDKRYYTWRHTYFDNKNLIKNEIDQGFGLKEFIIEDSSFGNWLVNIKSLNSTPDTNPTFLKYTLYKNYGLPNETKQVKVVNLSRYNQKITLNKFLY
jgi:tetratricopeptide (TPR) repeat protein